ncbi:hypothetical protein FB45DRAFT_1060634 [Roridomyces roridus]|uniref:Uncharacterized protein n=1 Tax=Roridomyces roridus TaxID=1738132 RepID=A0AAD7FL87_9AGAR|nr:hypothetical protein FB45DRAFT_1060634 [Roridomyces roridus]
MSDLCPVLPQDLERDIFLITSYTDPQSVPTLMLGAHRVKLWVEPLRFRAMILYGTILHRMEPRMKDFPFTNDETFSRLFSIPPATLRDSVRNLCLQHVSLPVVEYILSTCDNIQDLSIFPAHHPSLLDIVGKLRLRHLHCDLQSLFSGIERNYVLAHIDYTHSLFSNITHPTLPNESLIHLPRPTGPYKFLSLVPRTLRACPALRVILFQIITDEWDREVDASITRDPRFVQMALPMTILEHASDWLDGVLTGSDYWARAEEHIKKRIAGEVTTYVMDESMELPVVEQ